METICYLLALQQSVEIIETSRSYVRRPDVSATLNELYEIPRDFLAPCEALYRCSSTMIDDLIHCPLVQQLPDHCFPRNENDRLQEELIEMLVQEEEENIQRKRSEIEEALNQSASAAASSCSDERTRCTSEEKHKVIKENRRLRLRGRQPRHPGVQKLEVIHENEFEEEVEKEDGALNQSQNLASSSNSDARNGRNQVEKPNVRPSRTPGEKEMAIKEYQRLHSRAPQPKRPGLQPLENNL